MEILVAMGIILTLASLAVPVGKACIDKANAAREMSAARATIMGWRNYASENNGTLLPGYQLAGTAKNIQGQNLTFPTAARYPFRLAPYLDYELKGSLLANKQAVLLNRGSQSDYLISMAPTFGINLTFVGGDDGYNSELKPTDENIATYGKFLVTNINEIHSQSLLMVFASARITDASLGNQEGYNAIHQPFKGGGTWPAQYDEKRPYYDYGAIHPRYNGKAVCAMADGHVEFLSLDELKDMRRWSNQAAEANNPDWRLQPL